jgi:ATP-dependent Clp protease ATP-binding subunit ClpC
MPAVIESMELLQVLSEAEDIARSVNQPLTSAHQLLAFFTVPNRAEILLKDKRIDEDRILGVMAGKPREADGLTRDLLEQAGQLASGTGAEEIDCLHLLAAMSRVQGSCAHQLLAACGLDPRRLRTETISLFANGLPRKYRQVQPVRVAAPAARRAQAERPPDPALDPTLGADLDDALDGLDPTAAAPAALFPPTPSPAAAPVATPAPAVAPARPEPRTRHALDPRSFPWLSQLGRNLTELAALGKLDPLVGREREVEEAIDVLGKRRTNNPLLVGEPGVGKTAIVEGIAQRLLAAGGASAERTLVEIDMAGLVAGTQLRGSFSEKLLGLKDEVRRAEGRIVVFIDEVHTIMGAGSTGEGPQDAANELKAALARGEFPCIGATTHDEYRQHLSKDPALERRFTPVLVREPSVTDTVTILGGLAPRYERHHAVRYAAEALEAAATLSARHITDRFLPDKAVAVLDLAGSRARREGRREVGATDIARVVAKMAGLPEARLLATDRERILRLPEELATRVIGHGETIAKVARVLQRNFAGFASRRPMGSFLFLGPTGVGKTELARALADALHGSRDALVQLDMSECAEPTGVARLVGAAPGYVGYGEGGQLTDAVRRRPSCVVVLDEIEKAHRDVQMLLLQVLEEGRLTDGRGRQVDFSNTVVVLTTNLGGGEATRTSAPAMGFGAAERAAPPGARVLEAARGAIPPELWNRLDERLVFPALTRDDVARVAVLLLGESAARLHGERRIRYRAAPEVAAFLLEHGGWDPQLGARPMRGAVQRLVEAPLAARILAGEFVAGDEVSVEVAGEELRFGRAG